MPTEPGFRKTKPGSVFSEEVIAEPSALAWPEVEAVNRAKRSLIALDQFVNDVGGGWPDETLSSGARRWERSGKRSWPRRLIDGIFFLDPDHCRESYESERIGRRLPPELRVGE